jgi:hypothetical protein
MTIPDFHIYYTFIVIYEFAISADIKQSLWLRYKLCMLVIPALGRRRQDDN